VNHRLIVAAGLLVLAGCSVGGDPAEVQEAGELSDRIPDLVMATVHRILEHYGDDIDVAQLPEAHRVVLMVYHAHGLLSYGGFGRLFEAEFPGDPDYQLTLQAFDTIGAPRACEAFRRAFAAFPNATLPRDFEERIRVMRTLHLTDGGIVEGPGPNEIYSAAAGETLAGLQAYIAARPVEFSMLEWLWGQTATRKTAHSVP